MSDSDESSKATPLTPPPGAKSTKGGAGLHFFRAESARLPAHVVSAEGLSRGNIVNGPSSELFYETGSGALWVIDGNGRIKIYQGASVIIAPQKSPEVESALKRAKMH